MLFLLPLLDWFHKNRTPHFFREHRNPYRVWISEVALQQTRLATALPSLKHFLTQFPDIESLAKADEHEVVAAWAGLGYYNRAKNLHKGAIYLEKHFNGEMPQSVEELIKIPSIGPYTAAAIASICFGWPALAVDGNVQRVLSRWFCWEDQVSSKEFKTKIDEAEQTMKHLNLPFGDLNEALMEFGQKICQPRAQCEICFLKPICKAYQHGLTAIIPLRKKERERENIKWQAYLFYFRGKIVLQQPSDFTFFKGMYILPSQIHYIEQQKTESSFHLNLPFDSGSAQAGPSVKHAIMHYRITAHLVKILQEIKTLPNGFFAVSENDIQTYLHSSLMNKLLATADQPRQLTSYLLESL